MPAMAASRGRALRILLWSALLLVATPLAGTSSAPAWATQRRRLATNATSAATKCGCLTTQIDGATTTYALFDDASCVRSISEDDSETNCAADKEGEWISWLFCWCSRGKFSKFVIFSLASGCLFSDEQPAPARLFGAVLLLIMVYNVFGCDNHGTALAKCPAVDIPGGKKNVLDGFDCYDAEHWDDFVTRFSAQISTEAYGCSQDGESMFSEKCDEVKIAFVGSAKVPATNEARWYEADGNQPGGGANLLCGVLDSENARGQAYNAGACANAAKMGMQVAFVHVSGVSWTSTAGGLLTYNVSDTCTAPPPPPPPITATLKTLRNFYIYTSSYICSLLHYILLINL